MFGKLTAFVFSLLIMVQSMGIGYNDLLQLDELLDHAAYHQQQYGDSFFTFLSKHYGDQKEAHHQDHQDEEEQHSELPFQHQQCQHQVNPVFLAALSFSRVVSSNRFDSNRSDRIFFYFLAEYDSHRQDVFQPPRPA